MSNTQQTMQSVLDGLPQLKATAKLVGPCPECGSDLVVILQSGRIVSKPACPECGYKADAIISENHKKAEWTLEAHKHDAISYLTNSSVYSDTTIFNKMLGNFKTDTPKRSEAMRTALRIVDDVIGGQVITAMFNGTTGAGKTHLAMGIVQELLKRSDYRMKITFLNYRELYMQQRRGINDREEAKAVNRLLSSEVKKADVLIIDDLGSESEMNNGVASVTPYDNELAISLYDARSGKTTITTSNHTGKDLRSMYGSRVMSRIIEHCGSGGDSYNILFDGIPDYRVHK